MRATTGALTALLLAPLTVIAQGNAPYSIDPAQSKLEIHVYKEGVFKAFGHDHLIAAKQLSGQVQLDQQKIDQSSVRLHVPAKSLTVVDPGESEKPAATSKPPWRAKRSSTSPNFRRSSSAPAAFPPPRKLPPVGNSLYPAN